MFIFWSVWNPVPTVATTTSCVRQILFSCADTPAWHLWHMDHCRYPRQKRTGRPPYAGLQEIPTSFRVPRDRKDPSSEAASAHIDRRRISCHSLSSHQLPGATNYREEFYPDLEVDTIHALFNIPVAADQQYVVNYAIGKYNAIIVAEASKVADDTFHMIHDRLEKQVHRPLAIIAGEECHSPP